MGKTLFGFVIGIAVSAAVIYVNRMSPYSNPPSMEVGARDAIEELPRQRSSEGARGSTAESFNPSGPQMSEVDGPLTTQRESYSDPRNAIEPSTLEDLALRKEEAEAAKVAWQQAENRYVQTLAAIPVVEAVQLPPEFDWLPERNTVYHALFERQPIDPDWAPETEAQVLGFFAKQPEMIEKYGYPTVRCRTTHCEVMFVSYSANESQTQTIFQWDGYVSVIVDEPWGDQFSNPLGYGRPTNSYSEIYEEDGVTTILWHLWSSRD